MPAHVVATIYRRTRTCNVTKMKRRNFLKLGAMAAVAAVLPKTSTAAPEGPVQFPVVRIGDSWGTFLTNRDFGDTGPHWLVGDRAYFVNASGLPSAPQQITSVKDLMVKLDSEIPSWVRPGTKLQLSGANSYRGLGRA